MPAASTNDQWSVTVLVVSFPTLFPSREQHVRRVGVGQDDHLSCPVFKLGTVRVQFYNDLSREGDEFEFCLLRPQPDT